jgi:hypothetical protein
MLMSGNPDMHWEAIDGRHGGAVVALLADGWPTLPLTEQAVMVQRLEGLALVDHDDVHGWRATCTCFWQGEPWTRLHEPGRTDLVRRQASVLSGSPCDPPMAVLQALHAEWRAHAEREVALTELQAARRAEAAVEQRLVNAAAAARAAGLSWADIGRATGMSRQAAHERWRRS